MPIALVVFVKRLPLSPMKNCRRFLAKAFVAEEEGFEPPEGVNPQRFSRPPHSTTLPLLRLGDLLNTQIKDVQT